MEDDDALAEDLPGSSKASRKVDESQRIVEAHPELLSDTTDWLLGQWVEAAKAEHDADSARMLEVHRALLRRCREAGIARAFAEQMLPPEALAEAERLGLTPEEFLAQVRTTRQSGSTGFDIPPEVQPLIDELSRLTRRTDMPRRIKLCRQS